MTRLPLGGVERRVIEVLRRLDRRRFDPHIILLRGGGELVAEAERAGIPVHVVPSSRLLPIRLARTLVRLEVDVVHAHMYAACVPATIAAHFARVPVVLAQVHNVGAWRSRKEERLDAWLDRWRTGWLAVSSAVRDDVVQRLGVAEQRVDVVYNGIDLERFVRAAGERDAVRRAESFTPSDVVIVCVARLVPQKNHRTLLAAFAQARAACPALRLWCVGDGELQAELVELAGTAGVAAFVRFAGPRHDIPQILAASDISALVSHKEGFSNVVVESLAAGCPLLLTAVGGNREAATHEQEALFVDDPSDVAAIAAALVRLGEDAALRRRLGAAARQRGREFGIDAMVERVDRLYESLVQESILASR